MEVLVDKLRTEKVLSFDTSTKSIAWAIVSYHNKRETLIASGKIDISDKEMSVKFQKIDQIINIIIDNYQPDRAVIEQTIYISNFQTSRLLSYIVGYTWGRMVQGNIPTSDVGPFTWKSYLGYKKVMKKEKQQWAEEMGKTEANKKAAFERKDRMRQILQKRLPDINLEDDDIMDAIGIGLWALEHHE